MENHKEVTIGLQKVIRCPTGRHYRMTGPEQWEPWEKKYTCTKGQNKYPPPNVDVTSRYCDITSNIFKAFTILLRAFIWIPKHLKTL